MRHHHWVMSAVLIAAGLGTATRADAPRLRVYWAEKDAGVVSFAPDGRSLVTSDARGYQLRDAGTGQVRFDLSAQPWPVLRKAVFSPDSHWLFAQVITDRLKPLYVHDVEVWDVATGQLRETFPYVAEHLDEGSFELSADGRWLAFVDNSERLPVQVQTSKLRLDGRHDAEISLNAHPGSPRVKIWDIPGWKEVALVEGGRPLAFSPDGLTLATGAGDWRTPVARLWETPTGRLRSELEERPPGIWPLVFSPDGRFLASVTSGEIPLWEVANGRRWAIETDRSRGFSRGPVFSPDGRFLFPGGLPRMNPDIAQREGYQCFDLSTLPPGWLELGPGEVIVSPVGHRYAVAHGKRGTGQPRIVTLHELPSQRETGRVEEAGLEGAAFSPDGRWLTLLVGHREMIPPGPESRYIREIQLLDPATASVRFTIPSPGQTWGNYGWKFSADEKLLAVYYRTGDNSAGPGDPDPTDRPIRVDLWEIPPR